MVLDPRQPKPDAAQCCEAANLPGFPQQWGGARLLAGKEGARLTRGVYSYGTRPAAAEA